MDFTFSTEQLSLRNLAAQFAREKIAPHAAYWDQAEIFPLDTLREAAGLGLAGIYIDESLGGSGLSRLDAALIFEELATACASTAAYLSIHNMVAWLLTKYAADDLQQKWVPLLCKMTVLGSYCLTEPEAGSDAASLRTTAHRQGDNYIVNGAKAFISGGETSDIYLCMVRTGETGPKGISCLLIEKNTPGLSFGTPEKKLGWHNQMTRMVYFENCQIPVTNLVGKEGQGFNQALSALNGGRVNIAACSIGGAKACWRHAQRYLSERQQFGQALKNFQTIQFKMADLLTELEVARLAVYRAAHSLDTHHPQAKLHCAMAKRYATDIGFSIADNVLQLYGGYGYLQDYPIERYFRDLRVHKILEGTNEIMKMIIARDALADDFVLE